MRSSHTSCNLDGGRPSVHAGPSSGRRSGSHWQPGTHGCLSFGLVHSRSSPIELPSAG